MPTITESNITLTLPEDSFFRFQDCDGYKELKAFSFKEMDVGWFDEALNTLYLVELKDWTQANLENSEYLETRIWDLITKSVHSLNMILSILLEKPFAEKLKICIPFEINKETQIKIISIINAEPEHRSYFSAVYAKYKERFRPYAQLFDIGYYVVLTKDTAVKRFDWVS